MSIYCDVVTWVGSGREGLKFHHFVKHFEGNLYKAITDLTSVLSDLLASSVDYDGQFSWKSDLVCRAEAMEQQVLSNIALAVFDKGTSQEVLVCTCVPSPIRRAQLDSTLGFELKMRSRKIESARRSHPLGSEVEWGYLIGPSKCAEKAILHASVEAEPFRRAGHFVIGTIG